MTNLNVSDGGLRPLARLLEQATGFGWESVWIRGPRLSRTPRRSLRARPVRRAEGSSPRQPSHHVSCHVGAESGNPLSVGRISPVAAIETPGRGTREILSSDHKVLARHDEHVQSGGVCSAFAWFGGQLFSEAPRNLGSWLPVQRIKNNRLPRPNGM
jgi:hypothetical protein